MPPKIPPQKTRRVGAITLALTAALPTLARDASAQGYPTRPVRLILGFPAGGSTDLVARIMAAWLSERLGQSVVVENKPGAGTNLAAQTAEGPFHHAQVANFLPQFHVPITICNICITDCNGSQ